MMEVVIMTQDVSTDIFSNIPFKKVMFNGNAGEYFKIWIVNLFLSIITLGVYSAWATVRNKQYLYSNTEIDGYRFSFLGDPIQILKGRAIAFGLLAIYLIAANFAPVLIILLSPIIFFVTPYLIRQSIRFSMRMTAYRNVRLNFSGNYVGALVVYIALPIVAAFTFFILFPWVLKKQQEYYVEFIEFGDRKFTTDLSTSTFYGAIFASFVAIVGLAIISVVLFGGTLFATAEAELANLSLVVMALFALVPAFILFIASSLYSAMIRNHIFNATTIEQTAKLNSNVSVGALFKLRMVNSIALILTLGLAYPWVVIRTAQFYADRTSLAITDSIETVVDKNQADISAIGEEISGAFDIDVSLS